MVGAQGSDDEPARVRPALQPEAGVYNDTILAGLDYLMMELGKRNMLAVLYLNNSWEWSGGYSIYLQWAGMGKAPVLFSDGWDKFQPYVKEFTRNDSAQALFAKHVDFIVNRTNRYTGVKYTEDPALMSWQIGNEPRAFDQDTKQPFAAWLAKVSKQIKSLDKNHMVSIGSEGIWGCENDSALCAQIHADENVNNPDGGAAVADHHQLPPVRPVRQHTSRNGQQQRRQETQQGHQRHLTGASRAIEDIYAQAEAGQSASDRGDHASGLSRGRREHPPGRNRPSGGDFPSGRRTGQPLRHFRTQRTAVREALYRYRQIVGGGLILHTGAR